MYASLISAGASTLYDLYKSATSSNSATSSVTASSPATAFDASTDEPTVTGSKSKGAVNSTGSSGSSISDTLRKLFVDLQSRPSAPTADTTDQSASAISGTTNPFRTVASSLSAYAKAQGLGATSSTSLTA